MRRDRDFSNHERESILMVDDDDNLSECVDDDDDEDDDKRSISSESTCCGEFKNETLKLNHSHMQQQSTDFEIWRLFQVDDQNMRDIPNAEAILDSLTTADMNGKMINSIKCL